MAKNVCSATTNFGIKTISGLIQPDIKQLIDNSDISEHDILAISPISQGLSQECLLVKTEKQSYVIKLFNNLSAFHTELSILTSLQESNLTAKLISSLQLDDTGLILMEYLNGPSLNNSEQTELTKLKTASQLLAEFHHTIKPYSVSKIKPIAFNQLFTDLLTEAKLPTKEETLISQIITQSLDKLAELEVDKLPKVICHGDINFTNIIIDNNLKIIDFESASLMPAEYDIAMMLAINECSHSQLNTVIQTYQETNKALTNTVISIHKDAIKLYYIIALLINGLWFQSKAISQSDSDQMHHKAKAQFSLLTSVFPNIEKMFFQNN